MQSQDFLVFYQFRNTIPIWYSNYDGAHSFQTRGLFTEIVDYIINIFVHILKDIGMLHYCTRSLI